MLSALAVVSIVPWYLLCYLYYALSFLGCVYCCSDVKSYILLQLDQHSLDFVAFIEGRCLALSFSLTSATQSWQPYLHSSLLHKCVNSNKQLEKWQTRRNLVNHFIAHEFIVTVKSQLVGYFKEVCYCARNQTVGHTPWTVLTYWIAGNFWEHKFCEFRKLLSELNFNDLFFLQISSSNGHTLIDSWLLLYTEAEHVNSQHTNAASLRLFLQALTSEPMNGCYIAMLHCIPCYGLTRYLGLLNKCLPFSTDSLHTLETSLPAPVIVSRIRLEGAI